MTAVRMYPEDREAAAAPGMDPFVGMKNALLLCHVSRAMLQIDVTFPRMRVLPRDTICCPSHCVRIRPQSCHMAAGLWRRRFPMKRAIHLVMSFFLLASLSGCIFYDGPRHHHWRPPAPGPY